VATPTFGTALPPANFAFVGTLTQCPSSIGGTGLTVTGTVAAGGICSLPVQVNPAGLTTGVYSGQILLSATGQASGATPQTSVPIIVYIGPTTGNGLGLMLPVNVAPTGTGALPGTAPGTQGSYPLILSVPSGTGPTGPNQIPNPTLLQVTGLNNNSATAFGVTAPATSGLVSGSVTFTNVGSAFGSSASNCSPTYGSLASAPGSPFGPPCVWSIWLDATVLNSTNTTALAACGGGLGETGTVSFTPTSSSFPFTTLVVPLTVCVTDAPALILGIPNTYPNPTFGPNTGTGFGTCNGGNPDCLLAQPSNLVPGFPQSIVDTVIAASGGNIGATSPTITLTAAAGNSSMVCQALDLRTNGSYVNGVSIAPTGVQWLTINPVTTALGGAVYAGPFLTGGSAPNSLRWNSFSAPAAGVTNVYLGGITELGNALAIPYTPPMAAGPLSVNPDLQTFAICANTDPLGNAVGTYSKTVTINGAGVGPITVPVTLQIGNTNPGPAGAANFSEIGVFRGNVGFILNSEATGQLTGTYNYATAVADGKVKIEPFGIAGDIPVAGDWNASGVVTIGVFRNGQWILDANNTGRWEGTFFGDAAYTFGAAGDYPVVGDWNGDGKSEIGVFRPSTGQFILDQLGHGVFDATSTIINFGVAGDIPVAGNWTGTGNADQIGVFRPSTGQWILHTSVSAFWTPSDLVLQFGANGDVPVVGNWGNFTPARKRVGVFRPSTGQWILDTSGNGSWTPTDLVFQFGANGDLPVVGFWTMP